MTSLTLDTIGPAVAWQRAYALVAMAAREDLLLLPEGAEISTNALVERLYAGDDRDMVKRIHRALRALSGHDLKDCWRPGVTRQGSFGQVTPKLWHRPLGHKCPTCGGTGIVK